MKPDFVNILAVFLLSFCILNASAQEEDPAVSRFREYLRIPTVHPNPGPGYGTIF